MAVKPIPDGYHTVTPYLIVENADGVIRFLQEAFGAEPGMRSDRPDGKLMHGEVRLGDSVLMLSESSAEWPAQPAVLHLYVEDVDARYRQAMAAGATSVAEPADQFYGDRMAGVRDASGNQWWIATHTEDVPPEELERRRSAYLAEQAGTAGAGTA